MTKENEEMRALIKSVELMCHAALVGQPDDDEECRKHLESSVEKIRAAVSKSDG